MTRFCRFALLCLLAVCALSSCSFILPPRSGQFAKYTVQRGDTLGRISERFGVSVGEIEFHNGLGNPDSIMVGQVLYVPLPEGPSIGGRALERAPKSIAGINRGVIDFWRGKLRVPLANYRITSRFGRRLRSFHEGIDFARPEGTTIYAAHDGKVVYSGNGLSGYGNLVAIKNGSLMTVYAHNRRNLVRRGQEVRKGQSIAEVGSTGRATGPHLHFETRVRDARGRFRAVNPELFYEG